MNKGDTMDNKSILMDKIKSFQVMARKLVKKDLTWELK